MSVAAYSRLDVSARSQVLLISTVVIGSTGMLLLSACVNAGSLLLSRSAARRREIAVKLALGASRSVLVRQVVLESLAVSIGGAALGLLFAHWTARVLPAFFAPEEAAMLDTHLDAVTVTVTVALSCLAGAVFALGPARHALAKVDVLVLRNDSGAIAERSGSAVRGAVVVFQVALSTVLLIASGLMLRALSCRARGRSWTWGAGCGDRVHADAGRPPGKRGPRDDLSRCGGGGRTEAAGCRGRGLGLGSACRPQHESGVPGAGPAGPAGTARGRCERGVAGLFPGHADPSRAKDDCSTPATAASPSP